MRYLVAVLSAAFLAATVLAAVSVLDPQPAEAAGKSVKSCTGGKVTLKTNEYRMFRMHNNKRADKGLRKLCVHPALQKAARAHSNNMLRQGRMYHGNVGSRLRSHGYNWSTYGENVAWGSGKLGKPGPIFRRWMNSSGHRSNILAGKFREIGVGAASRNGKTYWTADFGRR